MPGRKKATEKEGKSLKTWVAKMRMPHDTGPQVAMKDSIYLYLYIYIHKIGDLGDGLWQSVDSNLC